MQRVSSIFIIIAILDILSPVSIQGIHVPFDLHGEIPRHSAPPSPRTFGYHPYSMQQNEEIPPPSDPILGRLFRAPALIFELIPKFLQRIHILPIHDLAVFLTNAVGLCGAAFLGAQLVNGLWKQIETARHGWYIRNKSDAFAKATFDDPPAADNTPADERADSNTKRTNGKRPSAKSNSSEKNTMTVEELQAEQEELWRVIHNIYKGQADKLATLENAAAELKAQFEKSASESNEALSMAMAKLTMRLEHIEASQGTEATDRLRIELRKEYELQAATTSAALRQEMSSLINQHDLVLVTKLKQFGDEIKSLLVQPVKPSKAARVVKSNNSTGSSAQS